MNDSTNIRIIADNIRKLNSRSSNLEKSAAKIPKNYSTDEIDTGLKWIDGATIYQKTFTGTHGEEGGSETLLAGIDKIINAYGYVEDGSAGSRCISGSDYFSATKHVYFLSNSGNLVVNVTSGFGLCPYAYTVLYTKPAPTPSNETKKKTTKKG